jgi:hypothetical protein
MLLPEGFAGNGSAISRRIMHVAGKEILFILGVGRSGTSMLARILSLCGGALPQNLKDPNPANPTGFWEPLQALKLNDEFLLRHRATYFDPTLRLQGEVLISRDEKDSYVGQIRAFLGQCPDVPLLVIKEPRITALFEFWLEAARQADFEVKVIIPTRHPQEVVASLGAWIKASPELWSALWLKYNLLAERYSRHLPRVFVEYSNLLGDWRLQVARISRSLAVELASAEGTSIDAFLNPNVRRQQRPERIDEPFAYPWLSDTYALLSEAAHDRPLDVAKLDEIMRAYRACERAFRFSLDDSRSKLPAQPPQGGIMTWSQETR